MFVHIILVPFNLPSGHLSAKELLTQLTICSLCILTICNLLFPVLVLKRTLVSDCSSSWSLHTCYLYKQKEENYMQVCINAGGIKIIIMYMYIALGQGQTAPWVQNFIRK